MIQKATDNVLSKVLYQASVQMKCGFSRSDN
ncbi:unknown [Firmicutes bacterium CAG:449]|nr:unknown [Firmicutes bacterium CAG:449]